ncbi:MAG: acetyltransferase [Planctomycetes bacterium]|nr:acetyltransferase [Planctomycetota bacterium]
MSQQPLIIYGAGDHGRVVADAAAAAGWHVRGFLDDRIATDTTIGPFRVIGSGDQVGEFDARIIVAVGDNAARCRCVAALLHAGANITSVVHPSAQVSPSAVIEAGVFIGPLAVVNAESVIDGGAIINSGAIVEHHNRIGSATHVAPGAVLTGRCTVGARALIGARAVLLPGLCVGDDAIVGAGAVVTSDVPAGATVRGNPARAKS